MTAATTPGPIPPRLLTLREVATLTGMGQWFLRAECQRGHLAYVKLSARAIRVSQADLGAYLAERRFMGPRPVNATTPPVRARSAKRPARRSA